MCSSIGALTSGEASGGGGTDLSFISNEDYFYNETHHPSPQTPAIHVRSIWPWACDHLSHGQFLNCPEINKEPSQPLGAGERIRVRTLKPSERYRETRQKLNPFIFPILPLSVSDFIVTPKERGKKQVCLCLYPPLHLPSLRKLLPLSSWQVYKKGMAQRVNFCCSFIKGQLSSRPPPPAPDKQ